MASRAGAFWSLNYTDCLRFPIGVSCLLFWLLSFKLHLLSILTPPPSAYDTLVSRLVSSSLYTRVFLASTLGQNEHRGHAKADSGCAVLTHDIFFVPAIAGVFPPTPAFHHPCNFGSTAAATTPTSASAQRAPRTTTPVDAQHAPTRANRATVIILAAPTAPCPRTATAHRLPVISRLVHSGIS